MSFKPTERTKSASNEGIEITKRYDSIIGLRTVPPGVCCECNAMTRLQLCQDTGSGLSRIEIPTPGEDECTVDKHVFVLQSKAFVKCRSRSGRIILAQAKHSRWVKGILIFVNK